MGVSLGGRGGGHVVVVVAFACFCLLWLAFACFGLLRLALACCCLLLLACACLGLLLLALACLCLLWLALVCYVPPSPGHCVVTYVRSGGPLGGAVLGFLIVFESDS